MKILSFDIGSHSIKAVELDVTFGRVELADYFIERVVENSAPIQTAAPDRAPETGKKKDDPAVEPVRLVLTPGQIAAIRRILADRPFRWDRLIVNIPRGWTTTRIFQFPTKDRKTIQASLSFEMEDDIPFSLNDVVYDFTVLNNDGTNSTVFTALCLRKDLVPLLSELQMLGLDPDMVTVDSWAVSQLFKRSIPKEYEGKPLCVINLGNRQTTIQMMLGDAPMLTHVCNCGGTDITQAIAQSYHLTYEQAEKAKVDGAFVLTQTHLVAKEPITEDQRRFSAIIEEAVAPIIKDTLQTLMSYKSLYKAPAKGIFITGGTSLIPNLQLYLEERLQLPVYVFGYMSRIVGQTLRLSESSEAQISTATGLALAMVKIDRHSSINFRKEAFAKHGGLGAFNMKALQRPLKYLAASLAFVYVNMLAQGFILSARATGQDQTLEHAIKSVLGALSPSVLSTYKNNPTMLKGAVAKEIAKYKPAQTAPPNKAQLGPLEVLNKVSAAIPRDMVLDVSQFQIKDGKLRMVGVVDQMSNSNRIAKALEDTKVVSGVSKDKVEEDPKSKKVKFEFSAKIANNKEGQSGKNH